MGIAKIRQDLREIVNAILYVNRTGIAWEYCRHDFPPYKTVCVRRVAEGGPDQVYCVVENADVDLGLCGWSVGCCVV